MQRQPHRLRHDGARVAALHAYVERDARAHLGLQAGRGGDLPAVVGLLEHVVGGDVGAVDELLDLQSGDLEHVLGLAQRAARHVGHLHHLLAEGVDRDVDRAPGLHLGASLGQLVEDDAAVVGRHEQRVVDVQLERALARDALRVVEADAREVGHGAPCAVARGHLHGQVRREGQPHEDRGDQREVPGQPVAAQAPPVGDDRFHCVGAFFWVTSAPSGRGRRR